METNWVWVLVAAVGQALCIGSVILHARAHPTSGYPLWRAPAEQSTSGRMLFALGIGVTVFGATMIGVGEKTPLVGALIGGASFIPSIAALIIANRVAASRRAAALPIKASTATLPR